MLRAAGDNSHSEVYSESGLEQEFFMVDEEVFFFFF
jgi:glutamine synthetase type III